MACFPGLAQAEEATGPQYTPEVPNIPNNESSNPPKDGAGGGSNDGDAEASESPDGAGAGGKKGSGSGGDNTGQGSPGSDKSGAGKGAGAGGAGELEGSKPITSFDPTANQASDDGSSPLVPILIAIAALAAISIGAFYYRQRRQGPDSQVSPRAS